MFHEEWTFEFQNPSPPKKPTVASTLLGKTIFPESDPLHSKTLKSVPYFNPTADTVKLTVACQLALHKLLNAYWNAVVLDTQLEFSLASLDINMRRSRWSCGLGLGLKPFEYWELGFECCWGHGCVVARVCCVSSGLYGCVVASDCCVSSGLYGCVVASICCVNSGLYGCVVASVCCVSSGHYGCVVASDCCVSSGLYGCVVASICCVSSGLYGCVVASDCCVSSGLYGCEVLRPAT